MKLLTYDNGYVHALLRIDADFTINCTVEERHGPYVRLEEDIELSEVYSVEPVEVELWLDDGDDTREKFMVMCEQHDENGRLNETCGEYVHCFTHFNNLSEDSLWEGLSEHNEMEDYE